jgi:hypothetical protein
VSIGPTELLRSVTTEQFRNCFAAAGGQRQAQIRRADDMWRTSPSHPSLRFKKVHTTQPIWSVRVDLDRRALGVRDGDTMVWFWVGPHSEYEALLRRSR